MNKQRLTYKLGLPKKIAKKIEKTAQTRGAEKDTIYQNRVSRSSTVLIPLRVYKDSFIYPQGGFERGYIVLASPDEYFSQNPPTPKQDLPQDLTLGKNLLVYYETRAEWDKYHPAQYQWQPANSRLNPLGGQYTARIPDTTNDKDSQIRYGYISDYTGGQGAGIRFYEYASQQEIESTKYQLSFLAWRTKGILKIAQKEGVMNPEECKERIDAKCKEMKLDDLQKLQEKRIIDEQERTICPLCLEPIKAVDLASFIEQAFGRDVPDLTVTKVNLFHVEELRAGSYNHCCYNLGWGHHHCNATVRDFGIDRTLEWMKKVLKNNKKIK